MGFMAEKTHQHVCQQQFQVNYSENYSNHEIKIQIISKNVNPASFDVSSLSSLMILFLLLQIIFVLISLIPKNTGIPSILSLIISY